MASKKEEHNRRASESLEIEKLPCEVYFNVLAKLPVSSLLECKLVSRFWYASVKDPMLTKMHSSENISPCLIVFSDCPKCKLQIADLDGSIIGNPNTIKVVKMPFESVLSDFEVVGSCNGLVCLYNFISNDPLYIYNPFTVEFTELPKLLPESSVCRVVFGFGYHSITKEYKAIKIIYYKMNNNNDFFGGNPEAFVLTLGTSSFRKIGRISHDLTGPTSEAEVNGKLHWLTHFLQIGDVNYRDIVSFDLETEEFRVVPRPESGGLNRTNYHLVTLKGCLSAVVSCDNGSNEIWVMKEYNVQGSWRKELIIREYVPVETRILMANPFRARRNGHRERGFRVLCCLKNGEIVFLHMNRCLACYNPENGEFNNLNFMELPLEFQAYVHVGSLISVDTVSGS